MCCTCTGIFSPIDSQLVTPVNKVTAAIAPTLRATPTDSTYPTMPPSGSGQPLASAPSSNPNSGANVMTSTQFSTTTTTTGSGGGGIFSPLDSGLQSRSHSSFFSRPSIATPGGIGTAREKLDTSLNLSAMGPPPSLPTTSRYATQVTQERLVASQPTPVHVQSASTQSVPSHPLEIRQSVGMNVQKNLYFLIVISTSILNSLPSLE